MAYWLFKSEPGAWSWDAQVAAGDKGTEWDGVRNYQARNVMREMTRGDLAFFYHSGDAREVVGIVKVVAEAHADSTDTAGSWDCVDVAAVAALPTPVPLARIKAEPGLSEMMLVKNTRLSVQPVAEAEWVAVCRLAGLDDPPRS